MRVLRKLARDQRRARRSLPTLPQWARRVALSSGQAPTADEVDLVLEWGLWNPTLGVSTRSVASR